MKRSDLGDVLVGEAVVWMTSHRAQELLRQMYMRIQQVCIHYTKSPSQQRLTKLTPRRTIRLLRADNPKPGKISFSIHQISSRGGPSTSRRSRFHHLTVGIRITIYQSPMQPLICCYRVREMLACCIPSP